MEAVSTDRTTIPGSSERIIAPVVVAVDGSDAAGQAVETAARLAVDLRAPLLVVHVRRGPWGFLGRPVYQRSLSGHMRRGRRVLDTALEAAARMGAEVESIVVEGRPAERIVEIARDRAAQLIVVGSRRPLIGRSVARSVVRTADRPVVVAPRKPAEPSSRSGTLRRVALSGLSSVEPRLLAPVPVRTGRRTYR